MFEGEVPGSAWRTVGAAVSCLPFPPVRTGELSMRPSKRHRVEEGGGWLCTCLRSQTKSQNVKVASSPFDVLWLFSSGIGWGTSGSPVWPEGFYPRASSSHSMPCLFSLQWLRRDGASVHVNRGIPDNLGALGVRTRKRGILLSSEFRGLASQKPNLLCLG